MMDWLKKIVIGVGVVGSLSMPVFAAGSASLIQAQTESQTANRALGTVKSISGNVIVVQTDAGAELKVQLPDSTRVLRISPGQKTLNDAVPAQLHDVQVGDRVLVRLSEAAPGQTATASTVVLMKGAEIAGKHQQEREDWDKRGVGGVVTSLDEASGAIRISSGLERMVAIQTTKDTVIRRYAPGSVKFDDAVRATFTDIKPGDQLRARGERSQDGNELKAEEIVAGTFRNVAGTIVSVDPAARTMTVTDLATKKPMRIRFSNESQLHQLPPMAAQRIAARLKGLNQGAQPVTNAAPAQPAREHMGAGGGRGQRPGGTGDVQNFLNSMPVVTLGELNKGDAVMVVTTEAADASEATAITLLSGVEPILAASPNDSRAAMLLSPWNLNGGGAEPEQ